MVDKLVLVEDRKIPPSALTDDELARSIAFVEQATNVPKGDKQGLLKLLYDERERRAATKNKKTFMTYGGFALAGLALYWFMRRRK